MDAFRHRYSRLGSSVPFHSKPYVEGDRTWKRMTLLTISSFGTQFLWSAEMSQASPHLLSLGLSKSQLSLVLMAGPLSGLFTQPTIGLYGDQNTHWLGRRRPLIIYGCVSCVLSLIAFAWAREIANILFDPGSESHKRLSTWIAVIGFYALDISINVVTVSNKCLVVDVLPSVEQQLANAYASRFSGISAILTMLTSLIDLPELWNLTDTTQLKCISYFGIPIFLITHLVMCLSVHEQRFVDSSINHSNSIMNSSSWSLIATLKSTFQKFWFTWNSLEGSIIKHLCWIQLWANIGWFPIMFYSTTWIGETWSRVNKLGSNLKDDEKATRIGTIGLLLESILALSGWSIIPKMVSNYRLKKYPRTGGRTNYDFGKTLVDLWFFSQVCFGFLLILSPFIEDNVLLSIGLIGACGIPWAVTTWVPSTLLGEAILYKSEFLNNIELKNQNNNFRLLPSTAADQESSPGNVNLNSPASNSKPTMQLTPIMEENSPSHSISPTSQPIKNQSGNSDQEQQEEEEGLMNEFLYDDDTEGEGNSDSNLAGTILGIHNVFIVIPQLLISCISFFIFNIVETSLPTTSNESSSPTNPSLSKLANDKTQISSIGLVFRVGGFASLASGYFCWKLSRFIRSRFLR